MDEPRVLTISSKEWNRLRERIEDLKEELEEARAEVRRWQEAFQGYAVHDDARCEYFGKCQCGLAELLASIQPAGPEVEE